MKHFKSLTPWIPVIAGTTGRIHRFASYDGVIGWLEVDGKDAEAIEGAITKKVGGRISAVSEKEYQDWKKKEGQNPSPRKWRQELSPGQLKDTAMLADKPVAPQNPAAADAGGKPSNSAPVLRKKVLVKSKPS